MEGHRTLETSFTTHDNKKIDVVYTNEEEIVVRVQRMYEGWLGIDKDKFVGLDLEYTPEHPYEGSVDLLSVANRFLGFLLLFFIHLLILQLLDFILDQINHNKPMLRVLILYLLNFLKLYSDDDLPLTKQFGVTNFGDEKLHTFRTDKKCPVLR